MTEYESIYEFKNLYEAYKKASRSKRCKKEVINFEVNLAENLWKLSEELKRKTYKVRGYHKFLIYDPKLREIQALSFKDRVLQRSLCDNAVAPYFEKHLVYDCAACRKNKGTHFAMNRLSEFMRDFYKKQKTKGYILKCDVRKFFDSIDHDVLKSLLRKYPDKDVKNLLYEIIDSYNKDSGKGLPMGNQTSQWFALYYLDKIDRTIKEKYRIKYYTRYMDDLVLLHESKEYLRECLKELTEIAEKELKITFNEKTQIFPISEGVDYLGWHFYITESGKVIRRLRTSNKRRFKRRIKAFSKKYKEGKMSIEDIRRSLASYNGHLKHGATRKLAKKVYGKLKLRRE